MKQIQAELKEKKGLNLSEEKIENIVATYFRNLSSYMRKGDLFYIEPLGYFSMTLEELEKRKKIADKKFPIAKEKKYQNEQRWFRKKRYEKKYKRVMAERKKNGLPLWTFEEFLEVSGLKLDYNAKKLL